MRSAFLGFVLAALVLILVLLLLPGCATTDVVAPVKDNLYALPPPTKVLTAMATQAPAPTLTKALHADWKLHVIPKTEPPKLGVAGTSICLGVIVLGFVLLWASKDPWSLIISLGGSAPIGIFWLFAAYPWVLPVTYAAIAALVTYLGWTWWQGRKAAKAVSERDVALDAIVPALDAAEPKRTGDAPSGPIKTDIAKRAGENIAIVRAVVDEAKARAGLLKG